MRVSIYIEPGYCTFMGDRSKGILGDILGRHFWRSTNHCKRYGCQPRPSA